MEMDKKNLAEDLIGRFISRDDRVGQAVQPVSVPVKDKDEILKRIEKHLAGDLRLGLYNLLPDGNVRWAVVEFEAHGPGAVEKPLEAAQQFRGALQKSGIASYIERSKSLEEENYHLWIFFENGIEAHRVNCTLKALLISEGLNPKCEVIPKTESNQPGNQGQFVWIPFFGGNEDDFGGKSGGGIPSNRTTFLNGCNAAIADPSVFLRHLKLVSKSQFDALELAMLPFMPNAQDKRASVRGTAKQLQRILDNCPFIKWCIENAAHLPEPLWWAMVSNLCRCEGGPEKIHEISKQDASPGRYSEAETDAKIERALEASGPITYETISRQGWTGEAPSWPKSPAGWGVYADLDSVLDKLKTLKGTERQNALRQHFEDDYHELSLSRQSEWLSTLAQHLTISRSDLERMALATLDRQNFTGRNLKELLARYTSLDASPEEKGSVIFKWFITNGGLVYRDRERRGFWIWEGEVYEVGNNQHYYSFVWNLAGITHEGLDNRNVWAVLKAETDTKGILLKSFTWLHTDVVRHRIHIFPNTADGRLIRIEPSNISVVANGANDDSVLLAPSLKMTPVEYTPLDERDYEDAWHRFDDLVLRNMATNRSNQLLYGSWALCYPLIDFVKTLPHLRCDGDSGAGKTRAMDLISHFIYGESQIKKGTDAANYADGAANPLILLDNVENRNFAQLDDFFLTAATGITKEKRKLGTDRETVLEKVHCLVNTNGIENLGKTEHINRTFSIRFDRWQYKSPDWSEEVYAQIAAERPKLVAAHMGLISRVLERIAAGGIKKWQRWLEQNKPGHSKDRSNSFIAMMALILEELLPIIDPTKKVEIVVVEWLNSQNQTGHQMSVESNPIITFLEAIWADEGSHRIGQDWSYEVEANLATHTILGTAAQFHRSFSRVAKDRGLRYEYSNPNQLSKRIADTVRSLQTKVPVLSKSGEEVTYTTSKFALTTRKNSDNTTIYTFDFTGGVALTDTKIDSFNEQPNEEALVKIPADEKTTTNRTVFE